MNTVYSNLYKKFKGKGNLLYLKYENAEFYILRKDFKDYVVLGQNSLKATYEKDGEHYKNYFMPYSDRIILQEQPLEWELLKTTTKREISFKRLNKYLKKSKGIVYQYALRSVKINKKNWI